MKKNLLISGIIFLLIATSLSGCVDESNDSNNENNNQQTIETNNLPVPIIKVQNGYYLWWNDTLRVTAEDSYDSDGNITGYVWWFDDGQGFTESKTGKDVSFNLPERNTISSSPTGKISLAVTDDKGDTAFAFNESIFIGYRPAVGLQQVGTSDIIEITYVANLPSDIYLYEEELTVDSWLNGEMKGWELYGYGLTDVDGNGHISEGDTINLSEIVWYEDLSGSTVKIELNGAGAHNPKTVVGSIEVDIA